MIDIKTYNWSSDYITIKGQTVAVEEFITLGLELWEAKKLAEHFDCSAMAVSTNIKKQLPELSGGGKTPLGQKILALFEVKKCNKCEEIKEFSAFSPMTRNGVRTGFQPACKDCLNAKNREEYASQPAKKEVRDKWKEANPGKVKAYAATSRIRRLLREAVIWADQEKIEEIYANCPEGYEVDHIIPLCGKLVSGLHVETNLQYLPAKENSRKSNKYEVE